MGRLKKRRFVVLYPALVAVAFLGEYCPMGVKVLLAVLALTIFCEVFYKADWKQCIFFSGLDYSLLFLADIVGLQLENMLMDSEEAYVFKPIFLALPAKLAWLCVLFAVRKIWKGKNNYEGLSHKEWWKFGMMPLFTATAMLLMYYCYSSDKKIQERIKDVSVSLSAADYFDIQQPLVIPVQVQLPEKAAGFYKTLRRDLLVSITETEDVTAVNAAALSSKCLQCASGAVYDDEGACRDLHDEKLQALESIIEEAAGEPVLVAYHWQSSAKKILSRFKPARLLDKDPETIAAWNRGEIPVLVTNPASAGHGLNLQDGGHILVVFDEWWDLEQYLQVIERIGPTRQCQAGHPRPVYIYHIMARGTLDPVVLARLQTKRKVQDLLLEYLKGEHDEAEN